MKLFSCRILFLFASFVFCFGKQNLLPVSRFKFYFKTFKNNYLLYSCPVLVFKIISDGGDVIVRNNFLLENKTYHDGLQNSYV